MNLISSVLICALVSSASAGLLYRALVSPRGLDIGSGLTLHLDRRNDSNSRNSSFFEKNALRVDFQGYGFTVEKKKGKEAIEVGLYENQNEEGRGKKTEDMLVPIMMGFKMTGLITFTFTLIAAFVIKALGVAKLALITAASVALYKLLTEPQLLHQSQPSVVEIEQSGSDHYPVASGPADGFEYHPSASANYYAYNNMIAPSAIASETALQYATVDPAATNNSAVAVPIAQQQAVASAAAAAAAAAATANRRDFTRRKVKRPIITIHRYSVET